MKIKTDAQLNFQARYIGLFDAIQEVALEIGENSGHVSRAATYCGYRDAVKYLRHISKVATTAADRLEKHLNEPL